MAYGGQNVTIHKTSCFLIAAISMRLQIDFRDLYAPNNMCEDPHSLHLICSPSTSDTVETAVRLFCQQFHVSIKEGNIPPHRMRSLLLEVAHLDLFLIMSTEEMGFFMDLQNPQLEVCRGRAVFNGICSRAYIREGVPSLCNLLGLLPF